MTSAQKTWLSFALVLLYFGIVSHGLLFTTEGAFERDAFYHARYAQMLPERGLSRSFPWMQFTDWKEHFGDKDFLYHVILAPFCRDAAEPLPGAKWATLLLGLAAYAAFLLVLLRLQVRWPIFWTLLLIVGSGLFFNRMLMVRSHVFSVLLMIVSSYFVVRDRPRAVFLFGMLYSWSYSVPLALVITAAGACAGRLAMERSWRSLRTLLAAAAGVGAGLAAHPYTPNSLSVIWQLINISLSRTAGVKLELGSEFRPIWPAGAFASPEFFGAAVRSVLVEIPGPLLALLFACTVANLLQRRWKNRTLSSESAAAVGAALIWFVALFHFSRLVEYFAPLAVLAAALLCRDAWPSSQPPTARSAEPSARTWRLAGLLAATVLLSGLHLLSLDEVTELMNSTKRHHEFEIYMSEKQWSYGRFFSNRENGGAVKWLRDHAPRRSTILNFHWDDFTELYYTAPDFYYIVGLDPTLMRLPYREQSEVLEAMRIPEIPLDFARLHRLFGADYLIMRNTRAAEYPELKSRRIAPVYEDDGAVIYKIGE